MATRTTPRKPAWPHTATRSGGQRGGAVHRLTSGGRFAVAMHATPVRPACRAAP